MSSPSASSEPPTVVLAHPHPEMRAFLRKQLAERYRALAVGRPREAWKRVREETPDLLVADEGLPEPGGRALCRQVKEAPGVGPIPVLLLTGDDADASRDTGSKGTDEDTESPKEAPEKAPREASAGESGTGESRTGESKAGEDGASETPGSATSPRGAPRTSSEPAQRLSVDVPSDAAAAGPDQRLEKPFSAATLLGQVGRLLGRREAVETALHLIDRRLGDPAFTVGDLAEAVDLSRRHLTRQLKEETGRTPAALLRQRRIEAAKRHLKAEADTTIKEVAEAVGFRSASHFSQVFREAVGQTPSAYRDRHASR